MQVSCLALWRIEHTKQASKPRRPRPPPAVGKRPLPGGLEPDERQSRAQQGVKNMQALLAKLKEGKRA